jgi:hypothetical protein
VDITLLSQLTHTNTVCEYGSIRNHIFDGAGSEDDGRDYLLAEKI